MPLIEIPESVAGIGQYSAWIQQADTIDSRTPVARL